MESIPAAKTNGASSAPGEDVARPYGIDTTTAGTLQEKYFMVLAGLMQKSLEVNRAILDQMIVLNKSLAPKVTEIDTSRASPDPQYDNSGVPGKGKKAK